jgi:hypothetical protein
MYVVVFICHSLSDIGSTNASFLLHKCHSFSVSVANSFTGDSVMVYQQTSVIAISYIQDCGKTNEAAHASNLH